MESRGHIATVSTELPTKPCGEPLDRLAVVDIARRQSNSQQFALIVDNAVPCGAIAPYSPAPSASPPGLEQAIQHILPHAQAGRHIVVYCSAGLGRTGLFLASLAKRALRLSGDEATQWVRQFLSHAIETPEQ